MTAFAGEDLRPETYAIFRERYRTPHYFEWRSTPMEYTARSLPVVYILGFRNGSVKVGQTLDFMTRLSANRSNKRVRGADLFCGWRLGSDDLLADEDALKRIATNLGGTPMGRSREWFTDVDVSELVRLAEEELVQSTEARRSA